MPIKKTVSEDAALTRANRVLVAPSSDGVDIISEFTALAGSYRALLRKLNKTLVISDGYQSQILELNNTLHQKVEEETEKRLARERMLAQHTKMAAMGEMIGVIAHQWRQPLATVSIIIQNIRELRRLGRLDDGYVEKAADDALSQIRFMSETIETFRGFFQPSKERESFSVSAKISEAASFIQDQLSASGITLELPEIAGNDAISGLPNEFTQAVLNLLANSRDAILERRGSDPPGKSDRIVVTIQFSGSKVVVAVSDTGCGVPAEVADRLFDPYFTTKGGGGGTGIGLYMSRMIIEESMGGRLGFTSAGGGTTFRIELPRETVT